MSWTDHIIHPNVVLTVGQQIDADVDAIDEKRQWMKLTLLPLLENPWKSLIPSRYPIGASVTCIVAQKSKDRFFVRLDNGLEVRAIVLGCSQIEHAADDILPSIGEEITAPIYDIDCEKRFINLKYNWSPLRDGEWIIRTVEVYRPGGFCMRPMQAFIERALRYKAEKLMVSKAHSVDSGCTQWTSEVDGKSLFSLLGLVAEQDDVLRLRASGPRAHELLDELIAFMESYRHGEDD